MVLLYILYENASGYALFRTMEFEEVGIFIPHVKKSVMNISKFRGVVQLLSFHPFGKIEDALSYMKSLSTGRLDSALSLFIKDNFPKMTNPKDPPVLGVQDEELALLIRETLDIKCITSGAVPELIRGIRSHFPKLMKEVKPRQIMLKSQQSLGHHYSRFKLNISANKLDTMIVKNVEALDQMQKDINSMTKNLRNWFSIHFPELGVLLTDDEMYVQCVNLMKNRNNLDAEVLKELGERLKDAEKVEQIKSAAETSSGVEILPEDEKNIEDTVSAISSVRHRRNEMTDYLKTKMNTVAPNVSVLVGEMVGARLISQAGSLPRLAKLPSSTLQVLGAKKSLFRTMKKKESREKLKKAKGVMSRFLANKCALASRADCFSTTPNSKFGQDLKNIVEKQETFLLTGKRGAEQDLENRTAEALEARRKALQAVRRRRRQRNAMKRKNKSNGSSLVNGISPPESATEKKFGKRKSNVVTDGAEGQKESFQKIKKKRKSLKQVG